MARTGRPKVEKPRASRVSIRFTEDEYRKLEKVAKKKDIRLAQAVRESVNMYLEANA